ncbi:MAG: arylesterase [Gammaproteobacteria bacterium]|nr:arylesterase [Gammaproteobacteria bacterium]MDH3561328.1 arylesterase [Gammaproteobacteria bacterium]
MKLRFLLLLLCTFICLLRPLAAETLLVVGDSLSAAYGMPVDQGWVALLQQQLAAENIPCTIINASISGDTTAAARARLPQTITRHRPDIVILQLGGNDGLRGLSLEAMKDNLAAMITTVRENGARVLLIGVQLPPNYGPFYTGKFNAIYHELADEYPIALLPSLVAGIGTEPELMQADGIHPNHDAQARIATRVREHLLLLLEKEPLTPD